MFWGKHLYYYHFYKVFSKSYHEVEKKVVSLHYIVSNNLKTT